MLFTQQVSECFFFFFLTPFDTWDCYYFGLNLSFVLFTKVFFYKKACNFAFKSSENQEITLPH